MSYRVKDSTCDNPFYEASCNEGIPTYETIGVSKDEQFSRSCLCALTSDPPSVSAVPVYAIVGSADKDTASHTPVLNPMYGRELLNCNETPKEPSVNKMSGAGDSHHVQECGPNIVHEMVLANAVENNKEGPVLNPLYEGSGTAAEYQTIPPAVNEKTVGASMLTLPVINPLYEIDTPPCTRLYIQPRLRRKIGTADWSTVLLSRSTTQILSYGLIQPHEPIAKKT